MSLVLRGLRLILIDDHAVVRMGFRLLLEGAGAEVVAEADRGESAVSLYREHQPDALIMDVSMPGMGGLAALGCLRAHFPHANLLMLSAHQDLQTPARALRAGARGYLSKQADPQELLNAVARVGRGESYIDPNLASQLAMATMHGSADPVACLTEKEFNVFVALARGQSVNAVAQLHNLSASTVGTHLYHIKQKLNASNAAELALIAVRSGLIEA